MDVIRYCSQAKNRPRLLDKVRRIIQLKHFWGVGDSFTGIASKPLTFATSTLIPANIANLPAEDWFVKNLGFSSQAK
jgi:hypothetical protein